MSRFVDRGAITAAYVGIGTAVTIVASFTLIIPIEWFIWLLVIPVGLTIGYYANQRSNRRAGPLGEDPVNGTFAALVTGVSMALLLLVIKAIFFFADGGYPDFNQVDQDGMAIPPSCQSGADCVYQRYVAAGRGAGPRGGRGDRCGLVRPVLLGRAARERDHDRAADHAERDGRSRAVLGVPPETGRGRRRGDDHVALARGCVRETRVPGTTEREQPSPNRRSIRRSR